MSTFLGLWETVVETETEPLAQEARAAETTGAPSGQFADQQLLGLIRSLFLGGSPKALRQVVFSGVSDDAGSLKVCLRVAETLANRSSARVCLVEAGHGKHGEEQEFGGTRADGGNIPEAAGAVQESSRQFAHNLWHIPAELWHSLSDVATVPQIRRRLEELRREFDYAVIHAPPIGTGGEAEALARLADGLVLVLEAHRTRRVLAQAIQRKLQAANVPVLGAVLSGRTFPIPERLYKRL